MKLEKWALIAEIVGGLGIIASLIFVGFQVQQSANETALNTRAVEVNAYQALVEKLDGFSVRIMEDPTLNILVMDETDMADLSREQRSQVISYFYNVVRLGDLAFYQYELGMLSEERMETAIGPINDRVCNTLFREFWDSNNRNFVEDFREFIDAKEASC